MKKTLLLRLHGQFFVVSLLYTDNERSGSERTLLSQRTERANALATSTGRRLVMNGLGRQFLAVSASHRIRSEGNVRLTVSTLRSLLGVQQKHNYRAIDKARNED